MSIEFQRQEFKNALPKWKDIRDITEGNNLGRFLLTLNPQDKSQENQQRNEHYRERAVFYSIAGHTARGMVGTVFRRDPVFEPPPNLEYLKSNVDGQGNSIYQQAQSATGLVIRFGRCGLWVDFPPTDGQLSRADLERNFATIHKFRPEQIINWRTRTDGSVTRLSLVALHIMEEVEDGFEIEEVEVIRELALDDAGQYFTRKWARNEDGVFSPVVSEETDEDGRIYPTDSAGSRLTEIPFTFVGSENNDASVDLMPMLDIVRANIGHYRNSADWEDSVWFAGQPQPWASGMTEEYFNQLKERKFYIGSRSLMTVPENQTFAFATADPNPVVRTAMMDKVELMIGLGARFIQPGGASQTATEARGNQEVQHSVLSLVAANVSDAYTRALAFVARFMGADDDVSFQLDDDFSLAQLTPQETLAMVQSWLQGAIPKSDLNQFFRRHGIIDPEKDDEAVWQEIEDEEFRPNSGGAALSEDL